MKRRDLLWHYGRARLRRFTNRVSLVRYQDKLLRGTLDYVRRHSPYYRRVLAGVTIDAFASAPTVSKAQMMENFDELNTRQISLEHAMAIALRAEEERDFSPTLEGLTVGLSSGTSGSRGLFLVSPHEAAGWAGNILAKVLPHRHFLPNECRIAFFLRANSNLYEGLGTGRIAFHYFDLLEPLECQLQRLEELGPTILVGPPSLLLQLAQLQKREELRLCPEKVVSVAEVLEPEAERFLREVYRQPIHQVYQATEGLLATTCEFGTIHLCEDLVRIDKEFLDAEQRRFVPIVSDLQRRTQPILRYRLNDVLAQRTTQCVCGSIMTPLEQIEGRCDDVLLIAGKSKLRALYPDFVRRTVVTSAPNATNYRIWQTAQDEFLVDVRGASVTEEFEVRKKLFELFSGDNSLHAGQVSVRMTRLQTEARGAKLRRVRRLFTPLELPPELRGLI